MRITNGDCPVAATAGNWPFGIDVSVDMGLTVIPKPTVVVGHCGQFGEPSVGNALLVTPSEISLDGPRACICVLRKFGIF